MALSPLQAELIADSGVVDGRLRITSFEDGWTVSGEVDSHTVSQLRTALQGIPSPGTVVLDIGGVSFMDSSALQAVIEITRQRRGDGGDLILRHPAAVVRRLIEITGLESFLRIES